MLRDQVSDTSQILYFFILYLSNHFSFPSKIKSFVGYCSHGITVSFSC